MKVHLGKFLFLILQPLSLFVSAMIPLLLLAFCSGATGFVSSTPSSVSRLPDLHTYTRSSNPSSSSNPGLELIRQLIRELHECRTGKSPAMRKIMLANKTVTCNDGSPSGWVFHWIFQNHVNFLWNLKKDFYLYKVFWNVFWHYRNPHAKN